MSETPHTPDSRAPREHPDDGASTRNAPSAEDASESHAPPGKASPEKASPGKVPPEKAPPRRHQQRATPSKEAGSGAEGSEDSGERASPAAKLKGLQEGETEVRRRLLAGSKRLQSLLTSNRPLGVRNLAWASLSVVVVIAGLLAATGRIDVVAQGIADSFRPAPPAAPAPAEEPLEEVPEEPEDGRFAFAELASHPDNALRPYFSGALVGAAGEKSRAELIRQFRALADRFAKRMGVDDNFSMRVTDARTDSLLEVYTLEEERQAYLDAGAPEDYGWGRIDGLRREKTRELVDKWVARGIPQDPIRVKWGMADKTREARQRDTPFIEYEIRLARFFGKSLLMTEIGTKETFNQDELVSPVNARSRYQLMPSLLREYGIRRYRLSTAAGTTVLVAEEQHPLLTMEPAFKYATASINAMGHEIPGLSAYHTGVNNVYTEILVKFLRHGQDYISPGVTTADAYLWGVTEGFDIVSRNSSFGQYSREYVAGAYGALKAAENTVVDTSQTMLADRVQLAEGQSITLEELLEALGESGAEDAATLRWNAPDSLSLYHRFRQMNKHFHLPAGPTAGGDMRGDTVIVGVPERGNVRIPAAAKGDPVRFFLPPGARQRLRAGGYPGLIDERAVFEFNHDTYADPSQGIRTRADHAYDRLIDEIRRFGFTWDHRKRLKELALEFEALAESNPSHYRTAMRDVIAQHRNFWRYPGWDDVSQAAQAALGRTPTRPQPPSYLPTRPLETPKNIGSAPPAD